MGLEKRFSEIKQDCGYGDYITLGNCGNDFPKQCVQICDEFAVGFANWLKDNCYEHNGFWYRNYDVNVVVYPTTELLEIYKQGL